MKTSNRIRIVPSVILTLALAVAGWTVMRGIGRRRLDAALMAACRQGDPIAAAIVLRRGADVSYREPRGDVALMEIETCVETEPVTPAALNLAADAVSRLDLAAADPTQISAALSLAVDCDNRHVVDAILARSDVGDMAKLRALRRAVMVDRVDMVDRLFRAGTQDGYLNMDHTSMLMLACGSNGHADPVVAARFLQGAARKSVNYTDRRGCSALMFAAAAGSPETVALLIEHGAHVNDRDHSGATALHYAAFGGSAPCVRVLLRNGAHPEMRDQEGQAPLDYAERTARNAAIAVLRSRAQSAPVPEHAPLRPEQASPAPVQMRRAPPQKGA
jgi:hypothetical protein